MMNIGLPELLALSVLWVIPLLIGYWVIRLAVRHGIVDAQRRLPKQPRPQQPRPPADAPR